jgi:hypothetical protein
MEGEASLNLQDMGDGASDDLGCPNFPAGPLTRKAICAFSPGANPMKAVMRELKELLGTAERGVGTRN